MLGIALSICQALFNLISINPIILKKLITEAEGSWVTCPMPNNKQKTSYDIRVNFCEEVIKLKMSSCVRADRKGTIIPCRKKTCARAQMQKKAWEVCGPFEYLLLNGNPPTNCGLRQQHLFICYGFTTWAELVRTTHYCHVSCGNTTGVRESTSKVAYLLTWWESWCWLSSGRSARDVSQGPCFFFTHGCLCFLQHGS